MNDNKTKPDFKALDEMENKQNLQSGDETYTDVKPDGLNWRYKRRRLAALGMPWGILSGMFIVWLASITDLPEWVSDAGLVVTGIGFVCFIVSVILKIKDNSQTNG